MESEHIQKEISALQREKKIHDAQKKLFEIFINMAKTSDEEQMLNITMQNALDIAARFSEAETGSLFLMDENGVVTDSILTQNQISEENRSNLIGKVIDEGLAGWVKENLSVGLITDTETDDRWLHLQDQAYIVRSVLAVPVFRQERLFGIITLMHSLPFHFDLDAVDIAQHTANEMALVIENATIYKKLGDSRNSLEKAKQSVEKYSKALDDELTSAKQHISVLETAAKRIAQMVNRNAERIMQVRLLDFILIIGISIVLGAAFNLQNPKGISFFPLGKPDGAKFITAQEADMLLTEENALLIDARPREFYELSHAKGAVSVPSALFDTIYTAKFSAEDPERPLIIYGRNFSRLFDEAVARRFLNRDHEQVYILLGDMKVPFVEGGQK